jgi:hypothetical protein
MCSSAPDMEAKSPKGGGSPPDAVGQPASEGAIVLSFVAVGLVILLVLAALRRRSRRARVAQPDASPPAQGRNRKARTAFVLVVVLVLAGASLLWYFGHTSSPDRLVAALATAESKRAPEMMQEGVRFDGADAMPGLILQYNYTLVGGGGRAVCLYLGIRWNAQFAPRPALH